MSYHSDSASLRALADRIRTEFPRIGLRSADLMVSGLAWEDEEIVGSFGPYVDGVAPVPLDQLDHFRDSLPNYTVAGMKLVFGQYLLAALQLPKSSELADFIVYRCAAAAQGDASTIEKFSWLSREQRVVICSFLREFANVYDIGTEETRASAIAWFCNGTISSYPTSGDGC